MAVVGHLLSMTIAKSLHLAHKSLATQGAIWVAFVFLGGFYWNGFIAEVIGPAFPSFRSFVKQVSLFWRDPESYHHAGALILSRLPPSSVSPRATGFCFHDLSVIG